MTTWADMLVAGLWQAGWAVVPVALVVAAVCRFGKCNATTRHALWLTTLAGLIAAMLLSRRAEHEERSTAITTGDGMKIGVLVFGLLRAIASLGDEK